MSATGRGKTRNASDFYPTDPRLVRGLIRSIYAGNGPKIPGGIWCEPASGDNAIVTAVDEYHQTIGRSDIEWVTCDIRPESAADIIGDFLKTPSLGLGSDVFLTNPPYRIEDGLDEKGKIKMLDAAMAFARECVIRKAPGGHVYLLLRFGFMTAIKRVPYIRETRPDLYPLTPRPSFGLNSKGQKGNDATEYCWFAWTPESDLRIRDIVDWREA